MGTLLECMMGDPAAKIQFFCASDSVRAFLCPRVVTRDGFGLYFDKLLDVWSCIFMFFDRAITRASVWCASVIVCECVCICLYAHACASVFECNSIC